VAEFVNRYHSGRDGEQGEICEACHALIKKREAERCFPVLRSLHGESAGSMTALAATRGTANHPFSTFATGIVVRFQKGWTSFKVCWLAWIISPSSSEWRMGTQARTLQHRYAVLM
jgi:hypothetical protein